jgi:flagellar basal body rod protein FlgG
MINGLYSGATALDVFSRQQELISSNLAHLNTPGHRRVLFSFEEKNVTPDQEMQSAPGMKVNETGIDFSQGRLESTGRPLDVSIQGDGFFEYQGEGEQKFYSRSGVLFRGNDGQLVNAEGMPILSGGSPVVIPPEVPDRDLMIDADGNVFAGQNEIGKLTLTQFDDNRLLESDSTTYFQIGQATPEPGEPAMIVQGMRELSNAHPVTELISLIIGSRHFEAAQRAMRTISDTIQENVRS